MKIRELNIPPQLELDLTSGRIALTPDEAALLQELLIHVHGPAPRLYELDGIVEANRLWESEAMHFYLGTSSPIYEPGNIEPRNTLIIGQAEPDSPIALDYRTNPARVVYFGDVEHESYWLELAPSYEALVSKLRFEFPGK